MPARRRSNCSFYRLSDSDCCRGIYVAYVFISETADPGKAGPRPGPAFMSWFIASTSDELYDALFVNRNEGSRPGFGFLRQHLVVGAVNGTGDHYEDSRRRM